MTAPTPKHRERLPLGSQVGYATAELGLNTVETVLRVYLLVYYTSVVGLRADLAGLAAALAIVWDAVTDPLMGLISDRTRHRFGGRRFWLPIGGVLLAVGVVLVFVPPPLSSHGERFVWLLGSYCLLNTGTTVLSVPYMAMAGELTADPYERSVLFGWRFAFANVGAVLAAAVPLVFLAGGSAASAMPEVSVVAAVLVVATALTSHRATRAVPVAAVAEARVPWTAAFVEPLRCRAFRPLLLAYVVATIGIGVNAATFFYYYEHCLRLPPAATQTVLATFLGMFTLSILLWVQLAKRFGKLRPLVVGATVLGIGTTALYVFVPAGGFWWVMSCGAIGLGAFVGSIVLIDTMLTDVIDYDQVRTGEQRSGLFFGVWRFASKLARAVSVAAVGLVLGLVGFDEQAATQGPAVERALVVLFGPGVGIFFLLSGFVLWRYRFDERKQVQVRRILGRRV
jgi:Na+/melibiose symporter-like transporter